MKFQAPQKVVEQTEFIHIEQPADAWKTMDIVEILQKGGVGVLPTDTGYGFVTPLALDNGQTNNKAGLERILRIKGLVDCKKPMSLLVPSIQAVNEYCFGIDKVAFKILKKNLPGAYTFILPAKTTLPKQLFLDAKGNKHSWKRETLGIRIPNDPTLRYLQDELLDGMPLLVTSLPHPDDEADEEDDYYIRTGGQMVACRFESTSSWCNEVDFVVDAGPRPYEGSTIFDLTTSDPQLVREGMGPVDLII